MGILFRQKCIPARSLGYIQMCRNTEGSIFRCVLHGRTFLFCEVNITVSFCGHSKLPPGHSERALVKKLFGTVEALIKEGADTFIFNVSGEFNRLSALVVNALSVNYPYIRLIVSVPYKGCESKEDLFDTATYLECENLSYLGMWDKNIEYIVEISDIVIAFFAHEWDANFKGFTHAKERQKRIISLA